MPNAIVIGAGILGAAVACRLSQAGVAVTVLEAIRPTAGTSSNSFAWVNANDKLPRAYHDLNAAGLAEHRRLAQELPGSGFHPSGHLEWAVAPDARAYLREKVTRLQAWEYRAELVERARAQDLAPDLVLPPAGAADYAYFPDEGWVAAPVLIHRLLEAAAPLGAEIVFPAPVDRLLTEQGRIVGAAAAGTDHRADLVIDCAGPVAGELLASVGLRIARQASPGLLAISEPLPTCLDLVVHTPGVYVRPDGAGRVRIGSNEVDAQLADALAAGATLTREAPLCQELSQDLLRRARGALPALIDADLEAVRLGWRAMPGDGLSAVGPVPGAPGYYLVFTHSGVTMGPFFGRLVAAEVTSGRLPPELIDFRPGRLVAPAPQP